MTVAELVEFLKELPQDAIVIRYASEGEQGITVEIDEASYRPEGTVLIN